MVVEAAEMVGMGPPNKAAQPYMKKRESRTQSLKVGKKRKGPIAKHALPMAKRAEEHRTKSDPHNAARDLMLFTTVYVS